MNNKVITKVGNELIKSIVNKFGSKVSCIILYGSYARGDLMKSLIWIS